MTNNCIKCGVELTDDNWPPYRQKNWQYICKECAIEQYRLWVKNNPEKVKAQNTRANRKRGNIPMSENKECSSHLGVYYVERVLSNIYPDAIRMPYGNPGYDIICNRGKKIDVKSGCILKNQNGWMFNIKYNTIADYFACIAFDNRIELNPLYMWMLPGEKFNHLSGATISPNTLNKWVDYKLNINKVAECCDTIRGTII